MISIKLSEEKFSQKVFDEFCKKNKLKFPQQFTQFLSQYNDGELDVNIVEGFNECCVRYFYGTTSESYSNIEDVYEGGNLVCISLNPKTFGKLYFWDHETMDVDEDEECKYSIEDMPLIANSFDELLKKIVAC